MILNKIWNESIVPRISYFIHYELVLYVLMKIFSGSPLSDAAWKHENGCCELDLAEYVNKQI